MLTKVLTSGRGEQNQLLRLRFESGVKQREHLCVQDPGSTSVHRKEGGRERGERRFEGPSLITPLCVVKSTTHHGLAS